MNNPDMFTKNNIEDILALTPLQEGFLFHYCSGLGSNRFFEQLCLLVSGTIDLGIFEKAWQFVVQSNEMLRVVFRWENLKKPVQIILKDTELNLRFIDYTIHTKNLNFYNKKELLNKIKNKDRKERFDIKKTPFRVILNKIDKNEYVILISNHHILFDGWSLGVILKEFFYAYEALYNKKKIVIPIKSRFKEFLKTIENQDRVQLENYWREYFKDSADNKPGFPIPAKRTGNLKNMGHYRLRFSDVLKSDLKKFVKKEKLSLAAVFYGVWSILLHKYSQSKEVIFDTTVSGRKVKIKGVEDMVGLFINTLPLKLIVSRDKEILELFKDISEMLYERESFECTPLYIIDENKKKCINPLFDSIVVVENYPLAKLFSRQNTGFEITSYSTTESTMYDLTVIFILFDEFDIQFSYNKDVFDKDDFLHLVNHIERIMKEIVGNYHNTIDTIKIASEGQRRIARYRRKRRSSISDGEVDRDSLSGAVISTEISFVPPGDEIEEKLVEIWASVFNLKKRSIGINSNFFEAGGHSLKAANLISKIYKEFAVNLPVAEIFNLSTIKDIAGYIKIAAIGQYFRLIINPTEKKEFYGLSSAQKRMYFQQELEPDGVSYNVPVKVLIEGNIEKERLADVFLKLIKRHEALRTSFVIIKNEVVQKIHREAAIALECYKADEMEIDRLCMKFVRPFNLAKAPLMRAMLIKMGDTKYILNLDMHHIVSDFASIQIFAMDFVRFYRGRELPCLKLKYKDFSEWQRNVSTSQEIKKQERYWLDRINGSTSALDLPTDFPYPGIRSQAMGDLITFYIKNGLRKKLLKEIELTKTTIFIYLLAVYYVLLFKYSGQEDITVGSTITGRSHPDLQEIFGMFVNMLAMRNCPEEGKSFKTFLEEVKMNSLNAYKNQDYQLDELIQNTGYQGYSNSREVFNTEFAMNNIDNLVIRIPGLSIKILDEDVKFAKFDLHYQISEVNDKIKIVIRYSTELFRRSTIEKMKNFFLEILDQVIENVGIKLADIKLTHGLLHSSSKLNDELLGEFNI